MSRFWIKLSHRKASIIRTPKIDNVAGIPLLVQLHFKRADERITDNVSLLNIKRIRLDYYIVYIPYIHVLDGLFIDLLPRRQVRYAVDSAALLQHQQDLYVADRGLALSKQDHEDIDTDHDSVNRRQLFYTGGNYPISRRFK